MLVLAMLLHYCIVSHCRSTPPFYITISYLIVEIHPPFTLLYSYSIIKTHLPFILQCSIVSHCRNTPGHLAAFYLFNGLFNFPSPCQGTILSNCLSYFSHCWDQIANKKQLKGGGGVPFDLQFKKQCSPSWWGRRGRRGIVSAGGKEQCRAAPPAGDQRCKNR